MRKLYITHIEWDNDPIDNTGKDKLPTSLEFDESDVDVIGNLFEFNPDVCSGMLENWYGWTVADIDWYIEE